MVVLAGVIAIPLRAEGFTSTSVGGHPGELDLSFRWGFETGKIEPNENTRSWQKAHIHLFTLGAGYTVGNVGFLEDFYARLDTTYFVSPAEVNDLERGVVAPSRCPAVVLDERSCRFYPEDKGGLVTPTVGGNLIHTADLSFGLYLQGTIPIDVDLAKFSNPRVDYLAGGTQLGVHLTPWFSYEARTFVGSGAWRSGQTQNASVSLTNLFVFEARRWLLPWAAGIKIGPYFDGDLTERFDARYDFTYSRKDLTDYQGDRVRSLRFAVAILPYFRVTESSGVELGYVQKAFGYDAIATKYFFAALRGVISIQ